jgi:hypothetical protein
VWRIWSICLLCALVWNVAERWRLQWQNQLLRSRIGTLTGTAVAADAPTASLLLLQLGEAGKPDACAAATSAAAATAASDAPWWSWLTMPPRMWPPSPSLSPAPASPTPWTPDLASLFPVVFHLVLFTLVVVGVSRAAQHECELLQRGLAADPPAQGDGEGASRRRLQFTIREFVFYRTDAVLSNWSGAKPGFLLLATYLLIMASAAAFYVTSPAEEDASTSFTEALWRSWTFVADPGTHADEQGLSRRVIALLTSIGGMLLFALLLSIISDSTSDMLDDLKKGRSRVIESNHTLILGWSDKVIPAIRELALANKSCGGGVVVVLADRDKEAMEADLRSELAPDALLGTEVVCRSGSPLLSQDLLKVSAQTARAVVVLSDPGVDADESDARAVRIVMSLTGLQIKAHIVVEMCDIDNRELVQLVGKNRTEVVVAHDGK